MKQGAAELSPGGARFSILGPLSVDVGGAPVPLGPLKQRTLLAMLLCRANAQVSVDVLIDALWDCEPPRTARKSVQVYISALRKLLDDVGSGRRLEHHAGGYLLSVGEAELDSLRFCGLARAGRDAASHGAPAPAARLLRSALKLWSGPPLPELRCSQPISEETDRLGNRYLQVYEDWAEVELRLGNAAEVADTIGDLVELHPLRERLRAAHMNTLFQLGRQTEAFAVYEGHRQLLASEFGLHPSAALEAQYRSMLAGGPYGSGGSGVAGPPAGPVRTQLPQDLPDFTGRDEQTEELLAVLGGGEQRLAVIAGPVGVGKTALAVHVAHRLAEAFPDGRLLLHVRDAGGVVRPWSSILADLARLTGLAAAPSADPGEAAAPWRAWVERHQVLLVLDDVTDEAHVRPLVPDSGRSAVLVTARPQLAGLESAYRVDAAPYGPAEALELLGRIVGRQRVESDRAAAQRIVAACGMLPLGVRASGLKLAVLRHLPLAEYSARLDRAGGLLDELVAGDLDVRHRLAASWRDLSATDRTALCRLGLLPESTFTLYEAAYVLACEYDAACRELESLIDAGVVIPPCAEVTAHAALYQLPRLAQVYARERAVAELTARHGGEAAQPASALLTGSS